MTRVFPILAVVGAIAYTSSDLWGPTAHAAQAVHVAQVAQQDDFTWRGQVAQGRTVMIAGVNGEVRASAASGNQVEVRAVKREGRRGSPADVRIEVVEHGDGVTICAVYPSRRDRDNECRADGGGGRDIRDNDTKVEFTVHVPAGVHFAGQTVNGDVSITGIRGNARATTVNGDVDLAASGHAEARTVNGSVHAVMGSAVWQNDLEFATVNGTITVELPADVRADVRAATVNGSIETDFPLTVEGRWGPRSMRGTIGGGGPELNLETVNGSIRLKRR